MAARGESQRVRETRTAFQVATAPDFIAAIECLVHRKVAAFASATDVERNVVFENFTFEPSSSTGDGDLPESLDEPGTPRPPSRLELSSEQRRAMRWRADARAPSRWS
jgi:hypothetical protein